MSTLSASHALRDLYSAESARIRRDFDSRADGSSAVRERAALVDKIATQLWNEFISSDPEGPSGIALVAIGGYGRSVLFPSSDTDLLFLCADESAEKQYKDAVRRLCQEMWDLRLRVSPTTRSLAECDRLHRDNIEFNISLLDCRYLAGHRPLFASLHDRIIPQLVTREFQPMVQRLAEVTEDRHRKYGNTIFHLEPNVKECPGGLRDYNVAHWLALIMALDKNRRWPDMQSLLPGAMRAECGAALEFLASVRCFLHFRHGRDDNTMTWDAQDEAAARGIGMNARSSVSAADWVRTYYRHVRAISRLATHLLDEVPPLRSSLYQQFQKWRSRVSNVDFQVSNGRIFFQELSAAQNPQMILGAFEFIAHHGFKLSAETERRIHRALPQLAEKFPRGVETWEHLRQILASPHAATALRAMHSLGLLNMLLPEFKAIDSLVIRDFYHRYTVDEHSFIAIDNLHKLPQSQSETEKRFAELLTELDQPDLLYLTLLLHDIGKGVFADEHVQASLQSAQKTLALLGINGTAAETINFLIANHLEMSAALRRDIFSPDIIAALAQKVATPERLKMLSLLTYADIKSVNPDALTPWKAEDIWQLYMATANRLNRNVDEERLHAGVEKDSLARVRIVAPRLGKHIKPFLDGLPQRYLKTHSAEEIVEHVEMASKLKSEPVQVGLKRARNLFELTLITADRPRLFATVAGVLAAWGMNIVKANAFSNKAGVIVDTFDFTDTYRTLELNLPEWERFKNSVRDVISGDDSLDRLMKGRLRKEKTASPGSQIATRAEFDNDCSSHSTLLEVIAQDRPGLLHAIGSTLAQNGCNIEVALIDTEGQVVIDVFYLTLSHAKLDGKTQQHLRAALMKALQG